jgi:hypothetical protein
VESLPDSEHGCGSRIRSDDEQKITAEPLSGLQGEGGVGGYQGRSDDCAVSGPVRCSPNQITTWKGQLEGGAADVFGPGGGAAQATPPVDVKALHAKIGELTLENDFLEGALSKAGLLNARR